MGARKKKERTDNIERLSKEIYELQQMHKNKLDREIHHVLALKRENRKDHMEQETRQAFNIVAKDRYKWGNKPCKYLARILKKVQKSKNYI